MSCWQCKEVVDHPWHEGTLLLLMVPLNSSVNPPHIPVREIIAHCGQDLLLPLWSFLRFFSAQFYNPMRSFWMAEHILVYQPLLPLSCYQQVAEGALCPTVRVVNEEVKQNGTQRHSLGYVNRELQLELLLLATTFWSLLFDHFSVYFMCHFLFYSYCDSCLGEWLGRKYDWFLRCSFLHFLKIELTSASF